MKVLTLKAHGNEHGASFQKSPGTVYEHPQPRADKHFGYVRAATPAEIAQAEGAIDAEAELPQLDHDGDGKQGGGAAGGSEPHDPPALTDKTKAELLESAEGETVEADSSMTKAEFTAAIESARAN